MDDIDKILQETEIFVNGEAVKFSKTIEEDIEEENEIVETITEEEIDLPEVEEGIFEEDLSLNEGVFNDDEDDFDIDNMIDELSDNSMIENLQEDNEVILPKGKELEIDFDEQHSLAKKIAENSLDVIKNAKDVYLGFKSDVLFGKDRSTSSKEMLIKSLEVQNQANKNLIDLAKVLEKDSSGNTNILIASQVSVKKTGVNPNNIKDHFKK